MDFWNWQKNLEFQNKLKLEKSENLNRNIRIRKNCKFERKRIERKQEAEHHAEMER